MQREPYGTKFCEIYSTKEAWFQRVENIIDEALVAADDSGPLELRILTPKSMPDFDAGSCLDFVLTPIDEAGSTEYITVSYCWAQPESLHSVEIPEYRIWESGNATSSRSLRCPKGVFHWALQFEHRTDCRFVWIDQECIHQSDPADVEKHLQVMDRVYSNSVCTVAPLATNPFQDHDYAIGLRDAFPIAKASGNINSQDCLRRLLKDAWFTRTWTFQERQSARHVYILVLTKCHPGTMQKPKTLEDRSIVINSDLCLDLWGLNAVGTPPRGSMPVLSCGQCPIVQKTIIDGCNERGNAFSVGFFYTEMERCENLITSDRIAIFGNS